MLTYLMQEDLTLPGVRTPFIRTGKLFYNEAAIECVECLAYLSASVGRLLIRFLLYIAQFPLLVWYLTYFVSSQQYNYTAENGHVKHNLVATYCT
jgi:hypothetical protein